MKLTKEQIEEKILAKRADLAISEVMDTPQETAAIKDEICGYAVDLASNNYRLEYPAPPPPAPQLFRCDVCRRRVNVVRQIHEERGDTVQMWHLCARCTTDKIPGFRAIFGAVDYLGKR
jgi:hypothetical protein